MERNFGKEREVEKRTRREKTVNEREDWKFPAAQKYREKKIRFQYKTLILVNDKGWKREYQFE